MCTVVKQACCDVLLTLKSYSGIIGCLGHCVRWEVAFVPCHLCTIGGLAADMGTVMGTRQRQCV